MTQRSVTHAMFAVERTDDMLRDGAFLDRHDTPDLREQGTGALPDAPAADLALERASV